MSNKQTRKNTIPKRETAQFSQGPNKAQRLLRDQKNSQRKKDEDLYKNQHLWNQDPTRQITPQNARGQYDMQNTTNQTLFGLGTSAIFPAQAIKGIAGSIVGEKVASKVHDSDASRFIGGLVGGGVGASIRSSANTIKARNLSKGLNTSQPTPITLKDKSAPFEQSIRKNNTKKPITEYNYPERNRTTNIPDLEKRGLTKNQRNRNMVKNDLTPAKDIGFDFNLINRNNGGKYIVEDGNIVFPQKGRNRKTTHFTYHRQVKGTNGGNWDKAPETLITSFDKTIKRNGLPSNLMHPMDTFFSNPNKFTLDGRGTKIHTINPKNHFNYRMNGIDSTLDLKQANIKKQQGKTLPRQENLQRIVDTYQYDGSEKGQERTRLARKALNKFRKQEVNLEKSYERNITNFIKKNEPKKLNFRQLKQISDRFAEPNQGYKSFEVLKGYGGEDNKFINIPYSPAPAHHSTSSADVVHKKFNNKIPTDDIGKAFNYARGHEIINKNDLNTLEAYMREGNYNPYKQYIYAKDKSNSQSLNKNVQAKYDEGGIAYNKLLEALREDYDPITNKYKGKNVSRKRDYGSIKN